MPDPFSQQDACEILERWIDESHLRRLCEIIFSERLTRRKTSSQVDSSQLVLRAGTHLLSDPSAHIPLDLLRQEKVDIDCSESADPDPVVSKTTRPTRLGPFLVVSLNLWEGGEKLDRVAATISSHFSLSPSRLYRLCGIICHQGTRPDSGHYVSYIRSKGSWFKIDDELVVPHSRPDGVLPYVLLYSRRDVTHGVHGILNAGNTCYMNAALQIAACMGLSHG